jgi:hypothetical protein
VGGDVWREDEEDQDRLDKNMVPYIEDGYSLMVEYCENTGGACTRLMSGSLASKDLTRSSTRILSVLLVNIDISPARNEGATPLLRNLSRA